MSSETATAATTATLLAAIEAMAATTRAEQPDSTGWQYGCHTTSCHHSGSRLRLGCQAQDDTDHIYSCQFWLDATPPPEASQPFKHCPEAAEAMAETTQPQAATCQAPGCAGMAAAISATPQNDTWLQTWQAAREATTGTN